MRFDILDCRLKLVGTLSQKNIEDLGNLVFN